MVRGKSPVAGSDIYLVKQHNLYEILLSIINHNSISRAQLVKETILLNTTIMNLTGELIEQGIIVESDAPEMTRVQPRRRVGRPRRMLQRMSDTRYVVGVHVGIGMFRVAGPNLRTNFFQQDAQFPRRRAGRPGMEIELGI